MSDPLVLLPAMMCDARVFLPQLISLSSERAVMVAPVTMGERIEEIASDLLAQLPTKFALCGLGLGGAVALEVLRRAPERITRLALIATSPLPESPAFAVTREPRIVAARSGRLADCIRDELPDSTLAPGANRSMVLAQVMAMGLSLGPEVFVRQSRAMQRRKDQQATLRRLRQPLLILCGEYDSLNTVKRHEVMAELIPFSRLEVVADAGAIPTLEQPEAVTRVLRDWLRQPLVLR